MLSCAFWKMQCLEAIYKNKMDMTICCPWDGMIPDCQGVFPSTGFFLLMLGLCWMIYLMWPSFRFYVVKFLEFFENYFLRSFEAISVLW